MLFYFKDKKTFVTKAVCEGITYKLVESVWTDISEITCRNSDAVQGDEFVFTSDGWIAMLTSVQHDGDSMLVKARKIDYMFDRDVCFTLGTSQPCEWTLLYYVKNWFIEGQDEEYNYRFLNFSRDTLEAKPMKPPATNGVFNVKSYIARIRRLNQVFTSYVVNGDVLALHVYHEVRGQKTLVTTNVPVEVIEESFGREQVAKVSTYSFDGQGWVFDEDLTHWYLMKDGSVSNDALSGERAEGTWRFAQVQNEDVPEDVARNIFAENGYTHKVVVRVPDDYAIYNFYDPVRVEVNNHVYMSYVSKKIRTSEGYVEYTFGNLKTSLTDKINEEE